MAKNILLFSPLHGNGGIASWTKKFIATFGDQEYNIIPISNVKGSKDPNSSKLKRLYVGSKEILGLRKDIIKTIKSNKIDIFHTTTSGSLGTIRDYMAAKICKSHNIRRIMHCRYGCIPQILKDGGIYARVLVKTMSLYNQVWVLDKYTFSALNSIDKLKGKIYLTPNSIEVQRDVKIPNKDFKNIAFIANIVPTKGIFELIDATKRSKRDFVLHIVGPASEVTMLKMRDVSGNLWGNKIIYHGSKLNNEAVEFMKAIDVLVLPTYYPGEAFPISILEAMSLGKLVISTPRAAIKDMLTSGNGRKCGILVREKSSDDILQAIDWIFTHKDDANALCHDAYKKVWNSYRTEVVYEIYRNNYRNLLN